MSRFLRYMKTKKFNQKSNPPRWNSCVTVWYDGSMDDLDIFIEDNLNSKTRLDPEAQVGFMDKILLSHDLSAAQKLEEDTRYYHELLSKFVRTYGH